MKKTLDSILKFGKKVIKPIVKPLLLTGALLVGGNAYSQQYQTKNLDKINVHKQSEIINDYYSFQGSGDVTGNGSRGMEDINAMDNGVANIQADVNLNGIQGDAEDRQLLLDNMNNGTILPYDWNALNTRAERDSTLFKATAIDGISRAEIPYDDPYWTSHNYATATAIFHNGWEKQNPNDNDLPSIYNSEMNNITGIPIFYMSKRNVDYNFKHGVAASHTGNDLSNPNNMNLVVDDVIDPYDWTFIEPQNNSPDILSKISDSFNSVPNTEFIISRINKFGEYTGTNYGFYGDEIVKFKINSEGKPELIYKNPNLIETREQAMDVLYPTLTVTTPQQDSTYNTDRTPINFTVIDDHFDRIGYSLNNADTTWLTTAVNSFEIQSVEQENVILFIAEDKAGNQTLEEIHYIADANYVGIEDDIAIPLKFKLHQNYPNPFNSSTQIQFTIPQVETLHATSLQMIVYDITGKEIATLVDNINTSGFYTVEWNASGYPAGIYFYQLQVGDISLTKKMLLMK